MFGNRRATRHSRRVFAGSTESEARSDPRDTGKDRQEAGLKTG